MNENTTVLSEVITEAQFLMADSAEETTAVEHGVEFTPENLSWSLPIMGKGMLGIFIVTAIIVATVVVLDRATKIKFKKKDKESK